MNPFTVAQGKAIAYLIDNLDTDQIAPANLMRSLTPDYRTGVFGNRRKHAIESGAPLAFDLPAFANASILTTGANFGCGSAREVAVWAISAWGIKCIVAPGFAPVFRESCLKNGLLPVVLTPQAHAEFARRCADDAGCGDFTADLRTQTLVCPDGTTFEFTFDEDERQCLLQGIDDVQATLRHIEEIRTWESQCVRQTPWLQQDICANSTQD